MKESNKKVKYYSSETHEVVDIILGGTEEQAEEVLKSVKGYKPIPGLNMMTAPMIRRLARNVKTRSLLAYGNHCGVPHATGKWESDIDGIHSISRYLREAGIDCEPSEGMKMVGCGPRNSRVNLYGPKGILAIMYVCTKSRPRVEGKIRQVYGLETVAETPTEIIPAPQTTAVEFTPEFLAQLVKMCCQEAVAAALAAKKRG